MAIDEGTRISSERREIEEGDRPIAPVTDQRRSKTGSVLGGLLALLLLAGAIYYFAGNRAGPNGPTVPSAKQTAENATVPTPTRPTESPSGPVASATPPQSQPPAPAVTPTPTPPAASPPPPATTADMPKAPPAAPATPPAQTATNNTPATPAPSQPSPSVSSPSATTAAPPAATSAQTPKPPPAPPAQTATNNTPPAQPPAAQQPPMRDQPAALPEKPAAAPKNEVIMVVKRGPANIRSEPGKNGRVVGTAAKDEQLKEISRSGSWVEVETSAGKGWISSGLLAPLSPQSR
jgi:hypothetical protein